MIKGQETCLILHEHDNDDDDDDDDDDDKNLLRSWPGVVPCGQTDRPTADMVKLNTRFSQ
jgi:hypothetical protein